MSFLLYRRLGFGFIVDKCPSDQLQTLLKLQENNDVYQVLKKNIRRLVNKYMDVKFVGAKQQEALHAIENELKEQYPEIFGTELEESKKRLYFLSRVVYHMHAGRRTESKRKQLNRERREFRLTHSHSAAISPSKRGMSRSVSPSKVTRDERKDQQSQPDSQKLASQPTHGDPVNVQGMPMQRSVSQTPSKATRDQPKNQQNQPDSQELASEPTHDDPVNVQGMPTQRSVSQGPSQATRDQRKNQESQPDSQELASQPTHDDPVNAQGMPQSVSLCPMDTRPDVTLSLSSQTVHDPNQYRAVYDFLDASVPPMTHLMDAFIDFGCDNADLLRAMSKWSLERIGCALDQLSPGADDGKLSGMERFILKHHFKDYFA